MNDLLQALHLKHVEKGLPDIMVQARMHSLTYDAFLAALPDDGSGGTEAGCCARAAEGGETASTQNARGVRFRVSTLH